MSKRVLQSTEASKTKALNVKLPAALYDEMQAFKADLHQVAPNLIFNASAICAEALDDALRRARKELEALKAEKQGGNQEEAASVPQRPAQGAQEAAGGEGVTEAPAAVAVPERRGLFGPR